VGALVDIRPNLPEMPELIYTWDLVRIRRESAPRIRDARGWLVRDESKRGLVEIGAMDAWNDDGVVAEYRLDCRLPDVPPKRTSVTAT
jgi:hypothetical protein